MIQATPTARRAYFPGRQVKSNGAVKPAGGQPSGRALFCCCFGLRRRPVLAALRLPFPRRSGPAGAVFHEDSVHCGGGKQFQQLGAAVVQPGCGFRSPDDTPRIPESPVARPVGVFQGLDNPANLDRASFAGRAPDWQWRRAVCRRIPIRRAHSDKWIYWLLPDIPVRRHNCQLLARRLLTAKLSLIRPMIRTCWSSGRRVFPGR